MLSPLAIINVFCRAYDTYLWHSHSPTHRQELAVTNEQVLTYARQLSAILPAKEAPVGRTLQRVAYVQ